MRIGRVVMGQRCHFSVTFMDRQHVISPFDASIIDIKA